MEMIIAVYILAMLSITFGFKDYTKAAQTDVYEHDLGHVDYVSVKYHYCLVRPNEGVVRENYRLCWVQYPWLAEIQC